MSDVNAEMAKLYLEASGLIIKLSNFIKVNEIPNSKIYLDAANNFINRNSFYKVAVNGFISPTKQYDAKPAILEKNTVQMVTQTKPMPKTFSYKSSTPEPPKPKPPVNNDDDLW